MRDTAAFCARLDALRVLRSHEIVNGWRAGAPGDAWWCATCSLSHYDPIYRQSMQRNFSGLDKPLAVVEWDNSRRR